MNKCLLPLLSQQVDATNVNCCHCCLFCHSKLMPLLSTDATAVNCCQLLPPAVKAATAASSVPANWCHCCQLLLLLPLFCPCKLMQCCQLLPLQSLLPEQIYANAVNCCHCCLADGTGKRFLLQAFFTNQLSRAPDNPKSDISNFS